MKRRASVTPAVAAALAMLAPPATAQERAAPALPVALYEITLDVDNDGKLDRAVLVAPSDAGKDAVFFSPGKSFFMFGTDSRIDLLIYLAAGDAPLDLTKPPSFTKRGIVDGERFNQVMPLESKGKGSLRVKSAYSLFGDWKEETLTVVYRRGEFVVAGLTYGFELKDGTIGDCDINFLTRTGVWWKGLDGRKRPVTGIPPPVKLSAWSGNNYPKACRF
jgi:hypothetical protein